VEPSTGARPLRRTIQRHIQDAVSEILINQHGEPVELIEVDLAGDDLTFQADARETLLPQR
jgi:ATP-dependent Clp protease ATP-binding subunit ClpA